MCNALQQAQLKNICKLVSDELQAIDSKEAELVPVLRHKVDKYKEVGALLSIA